MLLHLSFRNTLVMSFVFCLGSGSLGVHRPGLAEDPRTRSGEAIGSEDLNTPPPVTAAAWAIADGRSGAILAGHQSREPRKIASLTKLMCAVVVLSLAEGDSVVLNEMITISAAADRTGGSTAEVNEGERVSVREALYGLLLPSGNDMGNAIAEHFNDRFEPPTEAMLNNGLDNPVHKNRIHFIAEMNRRARRLGMKDTFYRIAYGDGGTDEQKTSTAADLCLLAHHGMQYERLRRVVSTPTHVGVLELPSGGEREQRWDNTNQLLTLGLGYDGMKTGSTRSAGRCLIASGHRDERHLIVVMLGADSVKARWTDTRNLFRWAWQNLD